MTHVTQLNNLLKLQQAYKDFMPFCQNDKVAKPSTEIHKVAERIDKINKMNITQAEKDVPFYFETKQSKLNFLNN